MAGKVSGREHGIEDDFVLQRLCYGKRWVTDRC